MDNNNIPSIERRTFSEINNIMITVDYGLSSLSHIRLLTVVERNWDKQQNETW